jgi:hypothetical protein
VLTEIDLTKDAIAHIRSCLSRGNRLSSLLLNLPLQQGLVRTFLPTQVARERLLKFDVGGLAKRNQTEPNLRNVVAAHLHEPDAPIAAFEDHLARPGDPVLDKLSVPFFTYNDEVYYFLTKRHTTDELITKAIRTALSYLFVCALVKYGTDDMFAIEDRQPMTHRNLEVLASNMTTIVVGAYDGEAYVFWSRT